MLMRCGPNNKIQKTGADAGGFIAEAPRPASDLERSME